MRTYWLLTCLLALAMTLAFTPGCPSVDDDDAGDDDDDDDDDATGDDDTTEGFDYCEYYISCVSEVDPASLGVIMDTYGDSGSCWDDADYQFCQNACLNGWDQLVETFHPSSGGGCFAEGATWFDIDMYTYWWISPEEACDEFPVVFATFSGTPRPEIKAEFEFGTNPVDPVDTVCDVDGTYINCEGWTHPITEIHSTLEGDFSDNFDELWGTMTFEPGGWICSFWAYDQG